jgi:hypothetical protein
MQILPSGISSYGKVGSRADSVICFAALRRFTKGFHDGFMLTPRFFRRRILLPREKIAIAAATSQGAQCAMPKTRTRPQDRDRSGGDRISWRRRMSRETQSYDRGR